jgi:hypothetical protein
MVVARANAGRLGSIPTNVFLEKGESAYFEVQVSLMTNQSNRATAALFRFGTKGVAPVVAAP